MNDKDWNYGSEKKSELKYFKVNINIHFKK